MSSRLTKIFFRHTAHRNINSNKRNPKGYNFRTTVCTQGRNLRDRLRDQYHPYSNRLTCSDKILIHNYHRDNLNKIPHKRNEIFNVHHNIIYQDNTMHLRRDGMRIIMYSKIHIHHRMIINKIIYHPKETSYQAIKFDRKIITTHRIDHLQGLWDLYRLHRWK